jgi:2-C-methyl-D-erythritol 4-phosphate cytidylyltransferase
MKKYAVIVAGGSGLRMGAGIPKQFLLLKGKPLLQYSVETFLTAFDDLEVILVLPAEHLTRGVEMIAQMNVADRVKIIAGGQTRFQSVKNGLAGVSHPSIVFVHDGVRCLVNKKLIERCYLQALEKGSAIPAVSATDSIRLQEDTSHHIIDRNKIRIVQTPQTFQSELLAEGFKQPYHEMFTDEASVVEAMGTEVFLIEGEHNNLKVTRPIDLCLAEKLLEDANL